MLENYNVHRDQRLARAQGIHRAEQKSRADSVTDLASGNITGRRLLLALKLQLRLSTFCQENPFLHAYYTRICHFIYGSHNTLAKQHSHVKRVIHLKMKKVWISFMGKKMKLLNLIKSTQKHSEIVHTIRARYSSEDIPYDSFGWVMSFSFLKHES